MLEMSLLRQQTGIYIYMYIHVTRVLETLEMSRNRCSLRHHNLVLVYVFG